MHHAQHELATLEQLLHRVRDEPVPLLLRPREHPIADAHRKAHACDPLSAYGGVIAANRTVTRAMAETVQDIFTEVVVAPGFEPAALEILQAKKNIRLLELPEGFDLTRLSPSASSRSRPAASASGP